MARLEGAAGAPAPPPPLAEDPAGAATWMTLALSTGPEAVPAAFETQQCWSVSGIRTHHQRGRLSFCPSTSRRRPFSNVVTSLYAVAGPSRQKAFWVSMKAGGSGVGEGAGVSVGRSWGRPELRVGASLGKPLPDRSLMLRVAWGGGVAWGTKFRQKNKPSRANPRKITPSPPIVMPSRILPPPPRPVAGGPGSPGPGRVGRAGGCWTRVAALEPAPA